MSTFTGDSRLATELMYPNRKPTIPVKVDVNDIIGKQLKSSYLGTGRDIKSLAPIYGAYPELEYLNTTELVVKGGRRCVYFGNGLSDVASAGTAPIFRIGTGSRTYSMNIWVTRLAGNDQYFLSRSINAGGSFRMGMKIVTDGSLSVFVDALGARRIAISSAGIVTLNKWLNVKLVIDRKGLMQIWLGGKSVAEVDISSHVNEDWSLDYPFYLGGYSNATGTAPATNIGFDGYIENFLVLDKALSEGGNRLLAKNNYRYLTPDIGA